MERDVVYVSSLLKSLICLYLPSPNSPALFKKTQQKCNKSTLVQSPTDRYPNKYNTYNKQLYLPISSFTDTIKSLLFSSSQPPMAFTASVTKQLGDLLQEQQEPFVLELYLIDKGYRKNMLLSKISTSNKFFTGTSRSEVLCKRRKIISICSGAAKALFDILKVKRGSGSQKTAEDTFIRKGQHKHRNLLGEEEADTDIKIKKSSEDRTQLSPISVLEATLSNEDSPVHINQTIQNTKTVREEVPSDSIYSNSYDSLETLLSGKTTQVNKPDSYPQHTKVKLALQQTKQLLFDCVKEIVETQRLKNRRQQQFREPMGAEAIGKILCENILAWSTQSVHVNYSNQLLDIDVLDSAEDWNDFEQGKGIGREIADYILEDISSDIVMDMIRK